jgi:hypothetical protein
MFYVLNFKGGFTMKQKSLIVAIMAVCCCFLAVNANAFTANFSDSQFSAANNQQSKDFPSYELGVWADISLPWGQPPIPEASTKITWNTTGLDGFGVKGNYGYENDEIEKNEVLRVGFGKFVNTQFVFEPVNLKSFTVSDLFYENGYKEIGWYNLKLGLGPNDYSGWIEFKADNPSSTNGEKTILVNQTIYGIGFTAPGHSITGQDHEFALKGMEYNTAVPEPTTLLLLGLGLIGVAYVRRTLKK